MPSVLMSFAMDADGPDEAKACGLAVVRRLVEFHVPADDVAAFPVRSGDAGQWNVVVNRLSSPRAQALDHAYQAETGRNASVRG